MSGLTGGATEKISNFFSSGSSCTYAHDESYDISKVVGGYAGVVVSVVLLRQGAETGAGDEATYAVGRRGGGPQDYDAPHTMVGKINSPATIGGRYYSGHALDEMQAEGFVPSIVEQAIEYGTEKFGASGRIAYYDATNHITVLTSIDGRVITVTSGNLANIR